MRKYVIIALCMGLGACAQVRAHLAFWRHFQRHPTALAGSIPPARTPKIAPGLWAMLDPGCATPRSADTSGWPSCAQPFWIGHDYAVVVQRRPGQRGAAPESSYKADYRLAAGAPLIAEIGAAGKGRLYVALTGLSHDGEGRLVGAAAAPFACPDPAAGRLEASPAKSGCETAGPEGVRAAARASLRDPAALTRVAFVAEGAPRF